MFIFLITLIVLFVFAMTKVIYDIGHDDGIREAKAEIEMLQDHINKLLKANYR